MKRKKVLQFGHTAQRRVLAQDLDGFVDPAFFKIDIEINGKVFKQAVDGLLRLEVESLDEISDAALDKALNDCSYWRYTFLAAGVEVEEVLMRVERQFVQWYAETETAVRTAIIKKRQEERKDGIPATWFGSITKQDIEHGIIINSITGPEYEKWQVEIADLLKKKKLLFGMRDVLQDRGGHLQSIGKRRLANRQLNFGVGSV